MNSGSREPRFTLARPGPSWHTRRAMLKIILAHVLAGLAPAGIVLAQPGPLDATKVGSVIAAFLVGAGLLRKEPVK